MQRSFSLGPGLIAAMALAAACADDSENGQSVDGAVATGSGGTSLGGAGNGGTGNAGKGAISGASSSTGGANNAGANNAGAGNGSGGATADATAGNGGAAPDASGGSGGVVSDASASSGGTSSGGVGNGGTTSGGASNGGSASGGSASGGASNGGSASGGASSGGFGNGGTTSGGASNGGSDAGGSGTGGSSTGGSSTGGSGTGGSGSGGTNSGGSCSCQNGGSSGTGGAGTSPVVGGCTIFPPDNPWNTRVDDRTAFPPDTNSDAILQNIKANAQRSSEAFLHPDFGSSFGIPFVVVPSNQATVPINPAQADESDPGPYPIPLDAPIEGGSDAHVISLQSGSCLLYELDAASPNGTGFDCYSAAKFDLSTNSIRTISGASCPTSADAAGLPIFPGLVKYDEVASGHITHAIRFTVHQTRRAFVRPATHYASTNTGTSYPPMGMRVRLMTIPSGITGQALVVATALKEYGMLLADNGSNWFISGAPDARFDDNDLDQLKTIPETSFEVVQMGKIYTPADCP